MGTITNGGTIPPGPNGTFLAGRYRVVRPLGQGGMGSVWLAEDTKLDGYKVAIKMLPSILVNNKRAYAQVKAEALVSLKLSHSNIATVRAFEEEDGNPFLVMDYIDGQTLDDYLAEKGKLTEEETIRLLKPVAAALDYAHTQGVVHRDVKPGNVMIRKDGVPFVLDFGIAREIQETLTRVTGKLSSGTLLYMSPEQLNGEAPKPAQDIYSFAAMAYECLKGEPPFTRGGIEDQIKNKKPEPLGPQFANCGSGVMAGLEKSPEARPAICVAVLSVEAKTTKKSDDKAPVVPVGKVRVRVVVALLVLAALAVGGWWWLKRNGTSETKVVSTAKTVTTVSRIPSAPDVESSAVVTQATTVVVEEKDVPPKTEAEPLTNANMVTRHLQEDHHLVDGIRAVAKAKIEVCRRIGDNDGFGALKKECEDALTRAEAQYELKRWDLAAVGYTGLVERVAELVRLDEDRKQAVVSRIKFDAARDSAVERSRLELLAQAEKKRLVAIVPPQPSPCPKCGNRGKAAIAVPCDRCGGKGREPCLECGPITDGQTGQVVCEHGVRCTVCGGSGQRNREGFLSVFREHCSDCKGHGWLRHTKCQGSGFLSFQCTKCGGKKMISVEGLCPLCRKTQNKEK